MPPKPWGSIPSSAASAAVSAAAAAAAAGALPEPWTRSGSRSPDPEEESTCPNCYEPYEPVEGPRFPRILFPCAHTFCTECIERQLAVRGCGAAFRCLTHNSPVVNIIKATDVKPNFAFIKSLEFLQRMQLQGSTDQVVEETAQTCVECDKPAVWYCKNDNACFCEEHKVSEHASKSRTGHVIVLLAERGFETPKCPTHNKKDLDIWCRQCACLCCDMCAHFGDHKAHHDMLSDVQKVAAEQRETIKQLSEQAKEVSFPQLDQASLNLSSLHQQVQASVEGTRRAIDQFVNVATASIASRAQALHEEARKQSAAGLEALQLRIEFLTLCRSQSSMVNEEATRVLRMSDHAVLSHFAEVQQSAQRAGASWEAFQANWSEPQPMQFLLNERPVLDEIMVAGLVRMPAKTVRNGQEQPPVEPSIPQSQQRRQHAAELSVIREQNQQLQQELVQQKEQAKQQYEAAIHQLKEQLRVQEQKVQQQQALIQQLTEPKQCYSSTYLKYVAEKLPIGEPNFRLDDSPLARVARSCVLPRV